MRVYPTITTLDSFEIDPTPDHQTTQSNVEVRRKANGFPSNTDWIERNTTQNNNGTLREWGFFFRISLFTTAYAIGSTSYIVFLLIFIGQKWSCFTKSTTTTLPSPNSSSTNELCPPPSPSSLSRSPCPSEWIYAETVDNCYKLIYMVNMTSGDEKCRSLGGALASIHSVEENRVVNEISRFGDNVTKGYYFPLIGAKRMGRGVQDWVWLDGTPWDYTNWAAGEPNHGWIEWGNYIEDCLMIYSDLYHYWEIPNPSQELHKWNDVPCAEIRRVAVCKRKARSQ